MQRKQTVEIFSSIQKTIEAKLLTLLKNCSNPKLRSVLKQFIHLS